MKPKLNKWYSAANSINIFKVNGIIISYFYVFFRIACFTTTKFYHYYTFLWCLILCPEAEIFLTIQCSGAEIFLKTTICKLCYMKLGAVGDGFPFIVHDPCLKHMCYINKQANSYFLLFYITELWISMVSNLEHMRCACPTFQIVCKGWTQEEPKQVL